MTSTAAIDAAAVTEGLARVRERIASTGRDPAEIRVVAMTKGFGADAVSAALEAGLVDIGENYADDLLAKADAIAAAPTTPVLPGLRSAPVGGATRSGDPAPTMPGPGAVRWHFTGAVQRNKIPRLAVLVAVWHGVDRASAVDALAKRSPGATVLVQVNLAGTPGRNGCGWRDAADVVRRAAAAGLDVAGLMGVASPDAERAAMEFQRLAALRADLGLRDLSIGMTADLELAVHAGSTIVRVGQALFGARPAPRQVRR